MVKFGQTFEMIFFSFNEMLASKFTPITNQPKILKEPDYPVLQEQDDQTIITSPSLPVLQQLSPTQNQTIVQKI